MPETQATPSAIAILRSDPEGDPAVTMRLALWAEIQARYEFSAPEGFTPESTRAAGGGFWVAFDAADPVGSIALLPLDERRSELDVMYVCPSHRRRGIADALLRTAENHAENTGRSQIVLRAGDPQPEALAFYRRAGYTPIGRFGRWVDDDTAQCFSKQLPHPHASDPR